MSEAVELGKTFKNTRNRDATHIAVLSVTSEGGLLPGQHIGFVPGSKERVDLALPEDGWPDPLGIVDPLLTTPPKAGEWFWMWMYPGTITGLRHEWDHPALTGAPTAHKIVTAEAYMRHLADDMSDNVTYEDLLEAGDDWAIRGDHTREDTESYQDVYSDFSEGGDFWKYYQIIRGSVVPESDQVCPFTCSC